MTYEDRFLAAGAEYFGGRLIYKNRDMGVRMQGGSLVLLPEGETALAQLEVPLDTTPATPPKAAPVKARSKGKEVDVVVLDTADAADDFDADTLLAPVSKA